MKKLTLPIDKETIQLLRSGDQVLLTGTIYTARDAAHQRIVETMKQNKKPPFEIKEAAIFFVGPSPSKPGEIIGSCGPTTSYRMDKYSPYLLDHGLQVMIGKGKRNQEVIDAIIRNKAIYFGAIGGLGAYLKSKVKSSTLIAYEDLGAEAVLKLEVEDFPVTVIIDTLGNNLYERGK